MNEPAGGYVSEQRLVAAEPRSNTPAILAACMSAMNFAALMVLAVFVGILWFGDDRPEPRKREVVEDVVVDGYHDADKFVTSKKLVEALKAERRETERDLQLLREDLREVQTYAERTRCTCRGHVPPPPWGSGIGTPAGAPAGAKAPSN